MSARWPLMLLASSVLWSARPTWADGPPSAVSATAVIAQAKKSYSAGDYLSAIRLLERSLAGAPGFDVEPERGEARLTLAAAYFGSGDRDGAQRALRALFIDAPNVAVSSAQFPPAFMTLVASARVDASAPKQKPPTDAPKRELEPPSTQQPPMPLVVAPEPATPRRWWLVAAPGLAVAIGGAACLFVARDAHLRLVTAPTSAGDVVSVARGEQWANTGMATQAAGWALVGVGSAAIVSGLVWWLWPSEGRPSP